MIKVNNKEQKVECSEKNDLHRVQCNLFYFLVIDKS